VAIFQPCLTCLHKNYQLTLSGHSAQNPSMSDIAMLHQLSELQGLYLSRAKEVAMTLRPFILSGMLLVAIPLAVSCGSGNSGMRQMLSLAVDPAVANPAPGANAQFTAIGTFNKPPSPETVNPMMWLETAPDGLHGGAGIAAVGDQSGLAHCNRSGTTWITATALNGALTRSGDPALVRGTAQLNCP
jgi:hypothetical protein